LASLKFPNVIAMSVFLANPFGILRLFQSRPHR
jgi:hypothetical protein